MVITGRFRSKTGLLLQCDKMRNGVAVEGVKEVRPSSKPTLIFSLFTSPFSFSGCREFDLPLPSRESVSAACGKGRRRLRAASGWPYPRLQCHAHRPRPRVPPSPCSRLSSQAMCFAESHFGKSFALPSLRCRVPTRVALRRDAGGRLGRRRETREEDARRRAKSEDAFSRPGLEALRPCGLVVLRAFSPRGSQEWSDRAVARPFADRL